jgi:streptogramin lyase
MRCSCRGYEKSVFAVSLATTAALTACGGSSSTQSASAHVIDVVPYTVGATLEPSSARSRDIQPVSVKFTYTTPLGSHSTTTAQTTASRDSLRTDQRSALSGAAYTGYTSTAAPISISLNITPFNGATTNYTGSCTPDSLGTSGVCAVTFTATPGATTISGALSESGNAIATFSNVTIIQPGANNTINFTANPVVSSVALQLAASSINAGVAGDVTLLVNAKDANGNIISGSSPYRDASGNPVMFSLKIQNNQAGGRGTAALQGATIITTPGQTPTMVHYDGNWLSSASVSLSSTNAIIPTPAPAVLTTIPQAYEYAVAGSPLGITSGPDGNIWFVEFGGNQIGKISTKGTNYITYGCAGCSSPNYITLGPDGTLWYTDSGNSHLDRITLAGTASIVSAMSVPERAVLGPDGDMWATTSTGYSKTKTDGTTQSYAGITYRGITLGPDGNFWLLPQSGTALRKVNTAGVVLTTYTIASTGAASDGIVTGPDGNIWFVNFGSDLIERSTTSGVITPFSLQSGATPRDITVGADGFLWFTEQGTNSIGRISTSGALTEYGSTNGIGTSSSPIGITMGPDGNIWFAESGSNKITKFVL